MRRPNDFYPTPAALTAVLLDLVPELAGSAVEPCAGDGALSLIHISEPTRPY